MRAAYPSTYPSTFVWFAADNSTGKACDDSRSAVAAPSHTDLFMRTSCRMLFPWAIGTVRLQGDAIKALARGNVERASVRTGERHVRRLARHLDDAKIFAGLVEDLYAVQGRYIQPVLGIDRHAVAK